ncbi:dioxygenase [Bailinhaonella thermotolerans]|nr:dioxygenase [Bailinhaonella thermotolerans]
MSSRFRRRAVLAALVGIPVAALVPAAIALWPRERTPAAPVRLPPTPSCGNGKDAAATAAAETGPYYTPGAPMRTSLLESGLEGERLVLSGVVWTPACRPVPGALLDFWHADDQGEYDNSGFRLRGRQKTDAAGAFRLETIMPAEYGNRTRHIHVKVTAPGKDELTTQLFFPEEERNGRDALFRPDLVLRDLRRGPAGYEARFTFVV